MPKHTCFFVCFWQQILEEQDFKEEDFGLFQLAGQRCIDEGHIDQLLEIIQNEILLIKVEPHCNHVTDIGQKLDNNFCHHLEPKNCFSTLMEIP